MPELKGGLLGLCTLYVVAYISRGESFKSEKYCWYKHISIMTNIHSFVSAEIEFDLRGIT